MAGGSKIPANPRVLVVGSGAREHTIVWKLAQSRHQPVLFAAPGNVGIRDVCQTVNISVTDVNGIVAFTRENAIDFVVIGPEQPLSLGLADACIANGIPVFGPEKSAAELESSKVFAKNLMAEARVPTARYCVFQDAQSAKMEVNRVEPPIVIKADGLAAGKGVVIAGTREEALGAIDDMMVKRRFGESGQTIVIEEFMSGSEVSLMFFVDQHTVVPMLPARDHKRIFDEDRGPNTGGMGAFAPVSSFIEAGLSSVVQAEIVEPTLRRLANRGIIYRGVLYVGLMMTENGPKVVEFNARFGDPETEVVLPLLASDLLDVMWAVAHDSLGEITVTWENQAAVCVVLAAMGYPESPRKGDIISLPEHRPENSALFHAGTEQSGSQIVTSGGRVLAVTATADTLDEAICAAYDIVDQVSFAGKQFRRDIAKNRLLSPMSPV